MGPVIRVVPPPAVKLEREELHFIWAAPAEQMRRPRVYARGLRVIEQPFNVGQFRARRTPSDLWKRFARLAGGTDEEIRRFAARWGPLLGPHESESVREWRRFAKLANAILHTANSLLTGAALAQEDLKMICAWLFPVPPVGANPLISEDAPVSIRRHLVQAAINRWFTQARGHLLVNYRGSDLCIEPRVLSLFGLIISQIAHYLAGAGAKETCSGCEGRFPPSTHASRGTRRYCPDCRAKGIPMRDAARDYRLRSRSRPKAS